MNIERLAAFFQGFRAGLVASSRRVEPRICLLTPGPLNESYFEQAYLAAISASCWSRAAT
jgi:uncharacterized circularly permuted ATP-grasp superfamily protein